MDIVKAIFIVVKLLENCGMANVWKTNKNSCNTHSISSTYSQMVGKPTWKHQFRDRRAIYLEAKHGGIILTLFLDDNVSTGNCLGGLSIINLENHMLAKREQ